MDKDNISSPKILHIILAVMILLQVGIVTWRFVTEKEGLHCDEPWSYGLANSYYKPFIYGDIQDGSYVKWIDSTDFYKWLDGDVFGNYLTVREDERFAYGSVWYNQDHDVHPPLYYVFLHTISSFFPNTFSRWFSYVINIAAMVIGQIFFFKAASMICRSETLGLLTCCLWGFCYGFTNINTYLRMYSMLIMFSIIFIYYHARLYNDKGNVRSNLIKLAVTTFLGALTHHYFLVAAFAIAACFCFYFLFGKKFKLLFAYAFSVAGAVGLSIAVFPGALRHMFQTDLFYENADADQIGMPFINSVRLCLSNMLDSISGFSFTHYATSSYAYAVTALVILAAIALPTAFLFRKEEWFKRFLKNAREAAVYFFKHFDFMFFFLLIGVAFTVAVISVTINLNLIGGQVDRYLSSVIPWAVLCLILTAKYILKLIKPAVKYTSVIIAVLVCVSVFHSSFASERRYMLKRYIEGEGGLETTVSDSSDYVVLVSYDWYMVCYADKLMGCNKAYFSNVNAYDEHKNEIALMDLSDDCYIVLDTAMLTPGSAEEDTAANVSTDKKEYHEKDIVADFETNILDGYRLQFYSSEMVFSSIIHTYKVVPESEYEDVPVVDIYSQS